MMELIMTVLCMKRNSNLFCRTNLLIFILTSTKHLLQGREHITADLHGPIL